MKFLPELYADIEDFCEIAQTEGSEIEALAIAVQKLFDDQFVDTASIQAIKRREQMLGIRADSTKESLDFRRRRLINRYSTKPPFTIRYLQSRLDMLAGEGRAAVEIDEQNYILKVTFDVPNAAYFKEIEYTIHSIKPANIVYHQSTSLLDNIGLEEHMKGTPLFRKTRLGTGWKLRQTPFAVKGQEVQLI
ncbi:putative phage tail protein [Paenibacillus sp. RC67]|uniref:putative phage tail protein n=1 Tax=Paenibacillus sp. RC67 TaxID=3039392 RepID=UPI0024AD9BA4|nr:putative phage tail protein [Paenibacillus sp. RC67]